MLAILYREKRPFFENNEISQNAHCVCVFGNPSGHLSGTTLCYFLIFYIFCFSRKKIKKWVKILVFIFYILLVVIMAVSRYFYAGHFINQLLLGLFQGYFFISLFLILENSKIFDIFFNMDSNDREIKDLTEIDFDDKNKKLENSFNIDENQINENLEENNLIKENSQNEIKKIKNNIEIENPNIKLEKNIKNNSEEDPILNLNKKKKKEDKKKMQEEKNNINSKKEKNKIQKQKPNLKKKERIIFFSTYIIILAIINIVYITLKYLTIENFENNPYHPFLKNITTFDNECIKKCFIDKQNFLSNSSFTTSVILNFTLFLWIFAFLQKKPLFEENKNYYKDSFKSAGFFFKRVFLLFALCLPLGFVFIFSFLFGQTWYCYLLSWIFVFIFSVNFVFIRRILFYRYKLYVKGDLFY